MRPFIGTLALLSLAAAALTLAAPATAQDFPSRPIRIVHPYPGGGSDAVIRALADKLKAMWGQPVLVDPKPGASETLAATEVVRSKPDGYTWFIGTEATFANNGFLFQKLPFDSASDLLPVSELFIANYALIVRGDLPANSLKEFIELGKKQGASQLKYGSIGVGTGPHLAMESMLRAVGIPNALLHVPYRTPPQAAQDMLGGNIDAVVSTAPFALPFLAGGRMKVLAVTGATRVKELPDTPTFAELGYPSVTYRTFFGVAVPKGTPPAVMQKIASGVREALQDPDVQKLLRPSSFELVASEPKAFAQMLVERRRDAQRVIQELGIHLD